MHRPFETSHMLNCFNIGVLESNPLRGRPSDEGVAIANSPPFSGTDSSEVSIVAPLSTVSETPLLATRRGRIVRKPSRFW